MPKQKDNTADVVIPLLRKIQKEASAHSKKMDKRLAGIENSLSHVEKVTTIYAQGYTDQQKLLRDLVSRVEILENQLDELTE